MIDLSSTDGSRFPLSGAVSRMRRVRDFVMDVLEVRPKRANETPWYRVHVRDAGTGWLNCVALISCEIAPTE